MSSCVIDINGDTMYFGFPTTENSIGVEICEDVIVHLDMKERKVVGFTILHWSRFKKKVFPKLGETKNEMKSR